MAVLGRAVTETGFDSLWLPEVLTRPGPDPLVGLAWVSGACPGLKIGTTMLLPGRNLVRLAKAVATLDVLSGGRFLLTFVPGLGLGAERSAVGIPTAARGEQMDDALPVLRRLWSGEEVSHDGPAGVFAGVSVSPRPAQDPFDVWLGGNLPAALDRCGRLADGWIPAFCTPEDAADGKAVIEGVAAAHGRTISSEHFGVSLAYAPEGTDVSALASSPLARRARGPPARGHHPGRADGLAHDARAFLGRRVLQVHRAPDGTARTGGGRCSRIWPRRWGTCRPRNGRGRGHGRHESRCDAPGGRRRPVRCTACPSAPSPSWRSTPILTTRPSRPAASWPVTPTRACRPCWSHAPTVNWATDPAE